MTLSADQLNRISADIARDIEPKGYTAEEMAHYRKAKRSWDAAVAKNPNAYMGMIDDTDLPRRSTADSIAYIHSLYPPKPKP